MGRVRIAASALADMTAHATAAFPRECCGLLVGSAGTISETVRTTNLEPGETRFLVDPAQHFALLKRLRGTSDTIVGAYHSHPRSEAVPSASDIAEAFSADFLQVIVSLADPGAPITRIYQIRGGCACELELIVERE